MRFLIIFSLCLLVASAAGFSCYQCEYYENNEETNQDCNKEPVPEEYLKPCKLEGANVTDWQCVKKSGKTVEDELKYVSRSCSAGKSFENSCKESSGLDSSYGIIEKAFKCYCNDEKCNGASTLSVNFFLVSLIALIGYTLY